MVGYSLISQWWHDQIGLDWLVGLLTMRMVDSVNAMSGSHGKTGFDSWAGSFACGGGGCVEVLISQSIYLPAGSS